MITIIITSINDDYDDKEHFKKLYDAHNAKMFSVANNILKSEALAEEAVQQTWYNIIKNYKTVKRIPLESVNAYLITSTKNVSFNILKKENFYKYYDSELIEKTASAKQNNNIQFESMVKIIREMPPKYGKILELKLVFEWKNEEIAKFLGINPSTVSTRIQRGRQMLAKKLRSKGLIDD